jgi:dTDP-glucose 4,6-dehydratase
MPLMILNALEAKPLPIYGDGGNVRDWIYVEDHNEAVLAVLERGRPGETYNVGGRNERTNLEIVDRLCAELERAQPAAKNDALRAAGVASYAELKRFVTDRPGHDRRYAIDDTKIARELGFAPQTTLEAGLAKTVSWYLANRAWCDAVQSGSYRRERLGTAR